jgi:hypothetical protein
MPMHGTALAQLPERFTRQPRTPALEAYITRKYSQYGYAKTRTIEYNPEFKPDYTQGRYRWVENIEDGLRHVACASDVVKLGHTGWYTDEFQDETVHGEVYQLPTHAGECRYVPAVNDPCNEGCACVDFGSITSDKEDAARWADSMAERWAESEREFRAKDAAEQRLADIAEEVKREYAAFRNITREIRANCKQLEGIAIVRELVRKEWESTRAQVHRLRVEREKIQKNGIEY